MKEITLELGDSAERKFDYIRFGKISTRLDSIRFTIVASIGASVVNFPEILYLQTFAGNLIFPEISGNISKTPEVMMSRIFIRICSYSGNHAKTRYFF